MARPIQWWYNEYTNELVTQTELTKQRKYKGNRGDFCAVPPCSNFVSSGVFRTLEIPGKVYIVGTSTGYGFKQSCLTLEEVADVLRNDKDLRIYFLPITWYPQQREALRRQIELQERGDAK